MKALVISSSPRRDGNSYLLAEAAQKGLVEAGAQSELIYLGDYLKHFLADEKEADKVNGLAVYDDRYGELFLDKFLPADGIIFATPLYWYSMSAQLKAFFDRTFSYISGSHPDSDEHIARMTGKKHGLLISSEETYPMAAMGITHAVQEYSRYTRSQFVGCVQGIGNSRGDVHDDPTSPIARAYQLGKSLLNGHYSDYQIDTPRDNSVWQHKK